MWYDNNCLLETHTGFPVKWGERVVEVADEMGVGREESR